MISSRFEQTTWVVALAMLPWSVLAQTASLPQAKLMINLRERPDLGSTIVGVLNKGDPAIVLEQRGEFVRLRAPGGIEGYLKHKHLANYTGLKPAPAASPPTTPAAATPLARA